MNVRGGEVVRNGVPVACIGVPVQVSFRGRVEI